VPENPLNSIEEGSKEIPATDADGIILYPSAGFSISIAIWYAYPA
jgi:hypothetical protein